MLLARGKSFPPESCNELCFLWVSGDLLSCAGGPNALCGEAPAPTALDGLPLKQTYATGLTVQFHSLSVQGIPPATPNLKSMPYLCLIFLMSHLDSLCRYSEDRFVVPLLAMIENYLNIKVSHVT